MQTQLRVTKRTSLVAFLVGMVAKRSLIIALLVIATLSVFTADASAMYHPAMGRFLQRDPGPGGPVRIGSAGPATVGGFVPRDPTGRRQYADGMNLYQYVRSNPTNRRDWTGLESSCYCGPDVTDWLASSPW